MLACASTPDDGSDDENALTTFDREDLFTGKWTNWYVRNTPRSKGLQGMLESLSEAIGGENHRATVVGLMKLTTLREWLVEENLFDTNPTAKVERIGEADVRCDERAKMFRRLDGTCNDLQNPAMGAANVRFGRNVPLESASPDPNLLVPSPREVSRKLLSRPLGANGTPVVQEVPFLNMFAATWIQFMSHDWFSHGSIEREGTHANEELIRIPLAADDPFRQEGMTEFLARKTETRAPDAGRVPSYYNENTHWWDLSQLYGTSKAVADSLRVSDGGVLKAELALPDGYLPVKDGLEQGGFTRNWWSGLSLMHSIFAREHNAIVAKLRAAHPEMQEEDLYDRARMINAAVMAKIHTLEWTPAILPNPILNLGKHTEWYGLKTALWGEARNEFFGADTLKGRPTDLKTNTAVDKLLDFFHVGGAAVTGSIGGRRDLGKANVPFSKTEEFTSVYRLHSLMPENLVVQTAAGNVSVPVKDTRNERSAAVNRQYSLAALAASFGAQKPGQLVLHNFPGFLQNLDVPGFRKYDVGAIDILRDRERGIPRYNAFRRLLQLKALDSIDEITDDANVRRELKAVYGNDIEKVDLLVGTLAEGHRPEYFGFGETQFQIFLLMAPRRILADRFYTEGFKPEIYTDEGIDWIEHANFKAVLSRAFPDLAPQMSRVENAFKPWDGSAGAAVPVRFP
jgi:hypothetical protein